MNLFYIIPKLVFWDVTVNLCIYAFLGDHAIYYYFDIDRIVIWVCFGMSVLASIVLVNSLSFLGLIGRGQALYALASVLVV